METVMWWVCTVLTAIAVLMGFVKVMRHGMGYPIAPPKQFPKDVDFIGDAIGLIVAIATVYFLLKLKGYV